MTEAPRDWSSEDVAPRRRTSTPPTSPRAARCCRAWMPWVILSVFVFIWGVPQVKAFLDSIWIAKLPGRRACTSW